MLHACAIEPAPPKEVITARLKSSDPKPPPGSTALIISNNFENGIRNPHHADAWVTLDVAGMRRALESNSEKFKVSLIEPENVAFVTNAIRESAMATGSGGTLLLLFAGFANERGELILRDGSFITYGNILSATGNPVPRFARLVTVVSASLAPSWVHETNAMDAAQNFTESVIVTSVPRLSTEGGNHDETTLSLLHPAASRLNATFRDALEFKKGNTELPSSLGDTIKRMQDRHELLYGPGPVVRISRSPPSVRSKPPTARSKQ